MADGSPRPGGSKEREDLAVVITKVQLLLAEKQVSLAVMRTGIAVYAVPLSILSILVATSKYYSVLNVLHLIIPLLLVCAGLLALGTYLVFRAIHRLRKFDQLIRTIKKGHEDLLDEVLDEL